MAETEAEKPADADTDSSVPDEALTFDQCLQRYFSSLGRYQMFQIGILCFAEVFSPFQVMAPVFTAATPTHWCHHPDTPLLPANCTPAGVWTLTQAPPHTALPPTAPSSCDVLSANVTELPDDVITELCTSPNVTNVTSLHPLISSYWNESKPCTEWDYSFSGATIVSEWDLVCSHAWMSATVASFYLIGMLLGALVSGWAADRYGRRRVMVQCGAMSVAFGVGCALSPYFGVFLLCRFLQGAFANGKAIQAFILALELTAPKQRVAVGCLYNTAWAVGCVLLTPLAYGIRDWRTLTLIITLPEVASITVMAIFSCESPRWLYVTGRGTEAEDIIRKMARWSHTSLPEDLRISDKEDEGRKSFLDLFRTPKLRRLSIVLLYVWAANAFVYYGLSLNTSRLAGNKYINFAIYGCIEIPSNLYILGVFTCCGRVCPSCTTLLLCGAVVIASAFVPASIGWVQVFLSAAGKFFIAVSFNMMWIYTTEMFPTCVRSIGHGTVNTAGRIASALSPFIINLGQVWPNLPAVVFGTVAVVAGGLILLLPETGGRGLPQTIADGESFILDNRHTLK